MVLSCVDDYLAGRRYSLEVITHLGSAAALAQSAEARR
jgi:hypothetical protein